MVRLARVVAPGIPHHIIQRGKRRQPTFFCAEDDACHLGLMAQFCRAEQVEIWALVNVPSRYRWSSSAAHLRGRDDARLRVWN